MKNIRLIVREHVLLGDEEGEYTTFPYDSSSFDMPFEMHDEIVVIIVKDGCLVGIDNKEALKELE